MEDLLTPVSTAYKNITEAQEDALVEVQKPREPLPKLSFQATNPQEALKILQNEPDFSNLVAVLKYLDTTNDIFLSSPSALGSQLINVLVSDIVLNYWAVLSEKNGAGKSFKHRKERGLLLSSLRNVTGLGAILARLKALINESKKTTKKDGGPNLVQVLKVYLDILEAILDGESLVNALWEGLQTEPTQKQAVLWREIATLIGSGRLLNAAAEAYSIANESSKTVGEAIWIADGIAYSRWLAGNIRYWARHLQLEHDAPWKYLGELLSKSLRLGYPGIEQSLTCMELKLNLA